MTQFSQGQIVRVTGMSKGFSHCVVPGSVGIVQVADSHAQVINLKFSKEVIPTNGKKFPVDWSQWVLRKDLEPYTSNDTETGWDE